MESIDNRKIKNVFSIAYKVYQYIAKVFLYSILMILILVGIGFALYFADLIGNMNKGIYKTPLLNAYVIISPSMEPTIKVEDAIVIMRKEPEELEVKDIITFISSDPRYSGLTITHRIVGIEKSTNGDIYYRTKGDNNNTEDASLVPSNNVLGKVILKIPKIGYIQYLLTQSYGWIIFIVIPCLIIVLLDVIKLIKSINKNIKKEEKNQIKDEPLEVIDDYENEKKVVVTEMVKNKKENIEEENEEIEII